MPKNKFQDLNKDDLLKCCLELEDELEKLRPKPPKFKLGQLACNASKNPWMTGQPAIFFVVLSVENRAGEWYYGYSKLGQHAFNVFPEKKCRALTATELDGSLDNSTPTPAEAQTAPNFEFAGPHAATPPAATAAGLAGSLQADGDFFNGDF